jgi:hypothetical protein
LHDHPRSGDLSRLESLGQALEYIRRCLLHGRVPTQVPRGRDLSDNRSVVELYPGGEAHSPSIPR